VIACVQRISRHLGIENVIDAETEFAKKKGVVNLQRDLRETLKEKDTD
jgi:hypothetical protein